VTILLKFSHHKKLPPVLPSRGQYWLRFFIKIIVKTVNYLIHPVSVSLPSGLKQNGGVVNVDGDDLRIKSRLLNYPDDATADVAEAQLAEEVSLVVEFSHLFIKVTKRYVFVVCALARIS
jgi:hypothetical protein